MGTKLEPGKYDCHKNAADDEPIFTLRAKDPLAAEVVRIWAALRQGQVHVAKNLCDTVGMFHSPREVNADKIGEALKCADDMTTWHHRTRLQP